MCGVTASGDLHPHLDGADTSCPEANATGGERDGRPVDLGNNDCGGEFVPEHGALPGVVLRLTTPARVGIGVSARAVGAGATVAAPRIDVGGVDGDGLGGRHFGRERGFGEHVAELVEAGEIGVVEHLADEVVEILHLAAGDPVCAGDAEVDLGLRVETVEHRGDPREVHRPGGGEVRERDEQRADGKLARPAGLHGRVLDRLVEERREIRVVDERGGALDVSGVHEPVSAAGVASCAAGSAAEHERFERWTNCR